MLPDDLKSLHSDGFQLIDPEFAAVLLIAALIIVVIIDRSWQ